MLEKHVTLPTARAIGGVDTPPHASSGIKRLLKPRPRVALIALAGLLALPALYHYTIYLPQPDQPHRLTLLDDLFALGIVGVTGLAGTVLGRALLRPFPLSGVSRIERGALALGLGWGALSLLVLALGLAHLLYPLALLLLLALILLVFWRDAWQLFCLLIAGGWFHQLRHSLPRTFFARAAALAMLIEVLLLLMQSFTLPFLPQGWDSYAYHWAVPRLFLLHHAIYAFPGWAHADFPSNTEMLNTIALAFQSPIAAVLLQEAYALLAVVLLMDYVARVSERSAAWIAGALCLCSPIFTSLIVSGYSEPALAYYGIATTLLVLAWLEQPTPAGNNRTLALLWLAGLLAGIGLGVKYTEGQLLIGVLLLLVIAALRHLWRARRQHAPILSGARFWLLALATYGLAALLPLLPWLAKDWALLGNPIYPFLWGGPGWNEARSLTGAVTFAHFGPHGPLWQRLLLAFWYLFFRSSADEETGFPTLPNYLLLAALLIPFWLAAPHLRRLWRAKGAEAPALTQSPSPDAHLLRVGANWLIVAGGGYLAWVLSHALVSRYALPWTILLTIPASFMLHRLSLLHWRQGTPLFFTRSMRVLATTLALSVLVALGPVLSSPAWVFFNPYPLLTGQVSLSEWQRSHLFESDYWAMVDYVNTHIPRTAHVLLVGQGTGYFLEGRDYVADSGDDWIPYLETAGRTPAGMLTLLQQDHFAYLVMEDATLDYVIHHYENSYLGSFLPAFRQFLAGSLIKVWSQQHFAIYAVPPAQAGP